MSKYSGVIFDFNGTLFWDTPLHNMAWDQFLGKYNILMDDNNKFRFIHGKSNQDILKGIFGDIPEQKINQYILEKEGIYQGICRNERLSLAPGAISFLDFLKANKVSYTIATSSGKENIDFYFDYLGLSKWFSINEIVYNDGTFKGKPAPDIYIKAMRLINKKSNDVMVFEDAFYGLRAAEAAKAGQIVIVNSVNESYDGWDYPMINNFDEVDRQQFVSG